MAERIARFFMERYLGDYFKNFNSEKFKLNMYKLDASVSNLIFSEEKINSQMSIPLKLKFGQLGSLNVQLPSLNVTQGGIKIVISEVFLCFEMLDLSSWKQENIVKWYQNNKKFTLKRFEDNIDLLHGEAQQGKGSGSSADSLDTLYKILANISVEVEKVYLRFEDEALEFSIGMLIPRISLKSTDKDFNPIQNIVDTAILYKRVNIDDVSLFVNHGSSFRSIREILQLERYFNKEDHLESAYLENLSLLVTRYLEETFVKSASRFDKPNESSSQQQADESTTRRQKRDNQDNKIGSSTTGEDFQFITLDREFKIECLLQFTLNQERARLQVESRGEIYNTPDFKLDLILGGLFNRNPSSNAPDLNNFNDNNNRPLQSQESSSLLINQLGQQQQAVGSTPSVSPLKNLHNNHHQQQVPSSVLQQNQQLGDMNHQNQGSTAEQPSVGSLDGQVTKVIDEKQLYVCLHFVTFLACYENFSQGVINEHFVSSSASKPTPDMIREYTAQYTDYREKRLKLRLPQTNGAVIYQLDQLSQIETRFDTSLLVRIRSVLTSHYFEKVRLQSEKEYQLGLFDHSTSSLGGFFGAGFSLLSRLENSEDAKSSQVSSGLKKERQRSKIVQEYDEKIDQNDKKLKADLAKVTQIVDDPTHQNSMQHHDMHSGCNSQQQNGLEQQPNDEKQSASAQQERGSYSTQLNFMLPNLKIIVHEYKPIEYPFEMKKDKGGKNQKWKVNPIPMCTLKIGGLRIGFASKTIPDFSQLSIELDSLSVLDPQVKSQVLEANKGIDMSKKQIIETVIETLNPKKVNQQHIQTSPKLFGFKLTTVDEEDFKNRHKVAQNAEKREQEKEVEVQNVTHDELSSGMDYFTALADEDLIDEEPIIFEDVYQEESKSSLSREESGPQNDKNPVHKQNNHKKEYHTELELKVEGRVIIYSNFFFVKKLFQLVSRIAIDMRAKRNLLLSQVSSRDIRKNIRNGFLYMQKLRNLAAQKLEELRIQRMFGKEGNASKSGAKDFQSAQNEPNQSFQIQIDVLSPSLVIDEFLLGERVINPDKPQYFLVDMGTWQFCNHICTVETEQLIAAGSKGVQEPQKMQDRLGASRKEVGLTQRVTYDILDMKFNDLKLLYSNISIDSLLNKARVPYESIEVLSQLNFGLYIMSLIQTPDVDIAKIPSTIVNLQFQRLHVNIDREVLCQGLKVWAFYDYGSWNVELHQMIDQLGSINDFSEDKKESYFHHPSARMLTTIQDLKICEDESDKGKEGGSSRMQKKAQNEGQMKKYQATNDLGWTLLQHQDLIMGEKEFTDPSVHPSEEDRKILKISPNKNTMLLLRSKSDTKELMAFENNGNKVVLGSDQKVGPLFQIDDSGLKNFFQAADNTDFEIKSNGSYLTHEKGEIAKEKLKGSGLRVNLILTQINVTYRDIKWSKHTKNTSVFSTQNVVSPSDNKRPSHAFLQQKQSSLSDQQYKKQRQRLTNFFRTKQKSMFEIKDQLELQSDSLKICVNMAPKQVQEDSELEVFVFLEKVSINDLANPNHVFNRLIEYPLLKDSERSNSGNRNTQNQRQQEIFSRLINVNRETNFVVETKKKRLDYTDFSDFYAINEYIANKNQFSIRYFSYVRDSDQIFGDPLPENATQKLQSLQSCYVKIHSMRVVGKFELIERTLQVTRNVLYDLENVINEYKANLELALLKKKIEQKGLNILMNKFVKKPTPLDSKFRKESMSGQVKAKSDLQDFSGIEEGSSVRMQIYPENEKSENDSSIDGYENVSQDLDISSKYTPRASFVEKDQIEKAQEKFAKLDKSCNSVNQSNNALMQKLSLALKRDVAEQSGKEDGQYNANTQTMGVNSQQTHNENNGLNQRKLTLTQKLKNMVQSQMSMSLYEDGTIANHDENNSMHKEIVKFENREFDLEVQIAGIQLVIPTCLTDKKRLTLSAKTNFSMKQISKVDALVIYKEIQEVQQVLQEQIYTTDSSIDVNLNNLQLFLRGRKQGQNSSQEEFQRQKTGAGITKQHTRFVATMARNVSQEPRQSKDNLPGKLEDFQDGYEKAFPKNFILYPIDFQYLSTYQSIENEHLKEVLQQIDNSRKAEIDPRVDLSQDNQSIQSFGHSKIIQGFVHQKTEMNMNQRLKLNLRIKEIRSYQNIVQLILDFNNRIFGQTYEGFADFEVAQNELSEQLDLANQNLINSNLKISSAIDTSKSRELIKDKKTQPEEKSSLSEKKQKNQPLLSIKDDSQDEQNANKMQKKLILGQNEQKQTLGNQSIDYMTTEDLVTLHKKAMNDHEKIEKNFKRIKNNLKINHDERKRTLTYSEFSIQSKGIQIILDDEVTIDRKEFLLGLVADNFYMKSKSLTSSVPDIFRAQNLINKDKEIISKLLNRDYGSLQKCLLYEQKLQTFEQIMNLNFKALFFNQKCNRQEHLVEPYRLQYHSSQREPLSQVQTCISSADILNLNLTYGCLQSIYYSLEEVKMDEDEMQKALNQLDDESQDNGSQNAADDVLFKQMTRIKEDNIEENQNQISDSDDQRVIFSNSSHFSSRASEYSFKDSPRAKSPLKKVTGISVDKQLTHKRNQKQTQKGLIDARQQQKFNNDLEQQFSKLRKVNFENNVGKRVTFWLSNELSVLKDSDFLSLEEHRFEIMSGQSLNCENHRHLKSTIVRLLSSYEKEDLLKAQVYMHIKVEGNFLMLRNLPLFKAGFFGHKLKKRDSQCRSQYLLIHTKQASMNETAISFETCAIFYNHLDFDLTLVGYEESETEGIEYKTLRTLDIRQREVLPIPLSWFEQNLRLCLNPPQFWPLFQDSHLPRRWKPQIDPRFQMLRGERISKVLDPNITEPYEQMTSQIKIGDNWVGVEFSMMATRTQFGQFIITANHLSNFVNLCMFSLQLQPYLSVQKSQINAKLMQNQLQQEQLELPSNNVGQDESEQEGEIVLETEESAPISQFNLQSGEKNDSYMQIKMFSDHGLSYAGAIDNQDLKRMTSNKVIGFDQGIVVQLCLSQADLKENQEKAVNDRSQEVINIAVEQSLSTGCLVQTNYCNFSLRRKIFHHVCCLNYDLYLPFVVVNQTAHPFKVFNVFSSVRGGMKQDLEKRTELSIQPFSNAFFNLKTQTKKKICLQATDYEESQKINLANLGFQYVIKMRKQKSQKGDSNEEAKEVEQVDDNVSLQVAAQIQRADQPYTKTKVLRIVPRCILFNKLDQQLVISESQGTSKETLLPQGESLAYDFLDSNKRLNLRLGLSENHTLKNAEDQQSKNQETERKSIFQTGLEQLQRGINLIEHANQSSIKGSVPQWSYEFSVLNIADFQITLPQRVREEKTGANQTDKEWSCKKDRRFVRVIVTHDEVDTGKLYVIFSHPIQPEYFAINYTSQKVTFSQKNKGNSTNEDYHLSQASFRQMQPQYDKNSSLKRNLVNLLSEHRNLKLETIPVGEPFVLNPLLPKDADILNVNIENHSVKVSLGSEHVQKITCTTSAEEQVLYQIQVRKSGSVKLIEFYEGSFAKLRNQSRSYDDEKVELFEELQGAGLAASAYQQHSSINENLSEQPTTKVAIHSNLEYNSQLYVVKLRGIGISIVDFMPQELAYISLEGIVLLSESTLFKFSQLEKKFYKFEASLRNLQVDACVSEACPIIFGPKTPFRGIERRFKAEKGDKFDSNKSQQSVQQNFVNIWVSMSEQSDGNIHTKSIEDVQIELAECELNIHLTFVAQIQDLLLSYMELSKHSQILTNSQLMFNFGIIYALLFEEDLKREPISQTDLLVSQYKRVKEQLESRDSNGGSKATWAGQQNLRKTKQGVIPKEQLCPLLDPVPDHNQRFQASALPFNKVFIEDIVISQVTLKMTLRIRGIERILQKRGPLGFFLNIGSNFADISDAEFAFSELLMSGLQESQESIIDNLYNHYRQEAISQFYQVFSSQDILGNPSSFIKNLGRGAVELQNAPFNSLLEKDPGKATAYGLVRGVRGLFANTALAVCSSYSGISGSVYLGLKNAANAQITHQDLDQPMSVKGGLLKGGRGFFVELLEGFTGLYWVPRRRVKAQGVGGRQILKGVGQGALQFITAPINAPLRATYDLATGVKHSVQGKKYRGQRFRYPRYFDENQHMPAYDPVYSHAMTALRLAKRGKYRHEVCTYALDLSYMEKAQHFKERILIITNEGILLVEQLKSLRHRVELRKIVGMMNYFYENQRNSVNLELDDGKVVRLTTKDAQKNQEFVEELRKQIQTLEKLDRLKRKSKQIQSGQNNGGSIGAKIVASEQSGTNINQQPLLNVQQESLVDLKMGQNNKLQLQKGDGKQRRVEELRDDVEDVEDFSFDLLEKSAMNNNNNNYAEYNQ